MFTIIKFGLSECKNREDNYGYVTFDEETFSLVTKYLRHWRPICVRQQQHGKKVLENIGEYLFLTHKGSKINSLLSTLVDEGWKGHRKKFNLPDKEFSLTRIRKAAQSKFEDELRDENRNSLRNVFNNGIGHK